MMILKFMRTLVAVIKDTLIRMKLSLGRCQGQCYDGASNMAGAIGGVAKQVTNEKNEHCFVTAMATA